MYNNAGTLGGTAAGGSVAATQTLPDTGGLALLPLTGTLLDLVLIPIAVFALVGGGVALLRLLPKREA